jgi:hypothetical protein
VAVTLTEIQDRLRQVREVCRSYDGGDRPSSPPAGLLKEIDDLERQYREAFCAMWVETPIGVGGRVIAYTLLLPQHQPPVSICVHRIEPQGKPALPGWYASIDVDFRGGIPPLELDADGDYEARVEGVQKMLRWLDRTARDLREMIGYPTAR